MKIQNSPQSLTAFCLTIFASLAGLAAAEPIRPMMKAIVGLVMTVEDIEGSFKLNQHKSDVDHAAIAIELSRQGDPDAQAIGKQMVALRPLLDYKSLVPVGELQQPVHWPGRVDGAFAEQVLDV